TGSGKSTLGLLTAGLVHPTSGAIRLDGADLRSLTADALSADVALVLQQAFVFDETVRWNVTLRDDIDEATVRWALRVAQAEAFVDALPQGLALRRAASADRPGPGARPSAPPADPRRRDQRLRPQRRAGDPRRHPPRDDRVHAAADRLPQVHHLPRRPGRLPRPRPGLGRRHP